MKIIGWILVIVLVVAGFVIVKNKPNNGMYKIELESSELTLSGIVTSIDKPENFNGYGIVKLNIICSNIEECDPRDTVAFYYCVMKDAKAEVYCNTINCAVGDTLNIDKKRQLLFFGGMNNVHNETPMKINSTKEYYEYIKQKTDFVAKKK